MTKEIIIESGATTGIYCDFLFGERSMDEIILNRLSNRLQEIGNELEFHKLIKKSSVYISKIYGVNKQYGNWN